MMTPSKQRKFAFNCLLKAIKEVSVGFLKSVSIVDQARAFGLYHN